MYAQQLWQSGRFGDPEALPALRRPPALAEPDGRASVVEADALHAALGSAVGALVLATHLYDGDPLADPVLQDVGEHLNDMAGWQVHDSTAEERAETRTRLEHLQQEWPHELDRADGYPVLLLALLACTYAELTFQTFDAAEGEQAVATLAHAAYGCAATAINVYLEMLARLGISWEDNLRLLPAPDAPQT